MRALLGCAAALVLMVLTSAPSTAMSPAPLAGPAPSVVSPAQFKWPWEARQQRRKPGQKRPPRSSKPKTERPAAPERGTRTPPRSAARPDARPARPIDPKDVLLPALAVPLGALPRGATAREAEGWTALAAEVGEPAPVPLLPPEGPAPAPATVAAVLATLRPPEPAAPPPAASEDDDDETPDMHVPLPPVRPGAQAVAPTPPIRPGSQAGATTPPQREGLSPEGGLSRDGGLAPEGQGLAPEGGVPTPTPRDERNAALEPGVPLPPEAPEPPAGPTAPAIPLPVTTHAEDPACGTLADETFAVAEQIPPIEGPGVCGGGPLVRLTGVKRKDGGLIAVKPAATLRCAMAKELADFLREDLSTAAEASGTKLEKLEIAGSFQCRGRNGAAGGKMSEHGRANAVDLSGFGFSDGREFGVFASDLPEPFKTAAKAGACGHFDTVLGPGSDGFHETHLHIDLQPRRTKAKLCQWSDPEVAKAKMEDKREAEASKGEDAKSGRAKGEETKDEDGTAGGKAGKTRSSAKTEASDKPDDREAAARRKPDKADEPLPKRREAP